jgi:hypothetical protein
MSPEERELLNRSVTLAEENNKILHSMRRSQRIGSIFRAVYWLFIIGSAVGAYYFIQLYLGSLLEVYGGGASDVFKSLNK